jgi:hypothetical protein
VLAAFGEASSRAEGTHAVAAFPDFTPAAEEGSAPPLLPGDPYAQHRQAGEAAAEPDLDVDPYAEDLALANPYTDELLFADPYADQLLFANPYADDLALANPYTSSFSAPMAPRAAACAREQPVPSPPAGVLSLRVAPGFQGLVFIDGVGVPPVTANLSVLPGRHVVVVYPQSAAPYDASVVVSPGEATAVTLFTAAR